ncbi:LysR family transcriptional regulator [Spartinivicinus poritis]|uniref:LysR family transcriptional regulator n=1 Tax=Spartinivicinus poritis TaxID=2994640 RepID=A0ABT5UFR4_9GAMM|nr:LysR family transcriptional regulator [Spartinivicinus sp. A2-2]MDE1465188.1 LysR family transcriptional regulator [Spartinivicinus sp. A2-2]
MDLRSLNYFIAVYELRCISAAARACFVAQPSISAAIHQLEGSLNTQLFHRHPKGVEPTEEGHRLYPMAKRLTNDAKTIQHTFASEPSPIPFRLGLMRSLGADRMSTLLKELTSAVDALELTLVNPEEPCDARIIDSTLISQDECAQPIWQDRYMIALPINHPLSNQTAIHFTDLAGLPFINRHPCDALTKLKQALAQQNIYLNNRAHIRTIEYALALVSAGVGAAFVPDWENTPNRADIVLLPLAELSISHQIVLAYREHALLEGPLKVLVDNCKQCYSPSNP